MRSPLINLGLCFTRENRWKQDRRPGNGSSERTRLGLGLAAAWRRKGGTCLCAPRSQPRPLTVEDGTRTRHSSSAFCSYRGRPRKRGRQRPSRDRPASSIDELQRHTIRTRCRLIYEAVLSRSGSRDVSVARYIGGTVRYYGERTDHR